MKKSFKEVEKEVTDFFKEAFCVSGKVRFLPHKEAEKLLSNCQLIVLELNDIKPKGTFYIARVIPK